jgi:hypothetical protein
MNLSLSHSSYLGVLMVVPEGRIPEVFLPCKIQSSVATASWPPVSRHGTITARCIDGTDVKKNTSKTRNPPEDEGGGGEENLRSEFDRMRERMGALHYAAWIPKSQENSARSYREAKTVNFIGHFFFSDLIVCRKLTLD